MTQGNHNGESAVLDDGADELKPGGHDEDRLAFFAQCLPGFIFQRRMTPDGGIRYDSFDGNVAAVLGMPSSALRTNDQGCLQVIHWADRAAHLAAIRHSAAHLDICVEEFRAITADGDVCWLKGRSVPRRLADGTVLWDGVLVDVTAAHRAEFRLDMLMGHAVDSILVLDGLGQVDTANNAAGRLFGWDEMEMSGHMFGDFLAESLDLADLPEDDSGFAALPREYVGRRRDGSVFPLELAISPVRLEGRRLYVVIGRDITIRKATEAALRDSEHRLRAIAANMPGMVFRRVLKPDGRLEYTYVSGGCRDFLGVEPEELMADPQIFMRAMSAEERQRFLAALGRSAQTMEPFEEETAVLGLDGRRRWLRGQSRPTLRDDGDVVWDGMVIDVTDRKLAEQRLSFLAFHDSLTRLPNRPAFLERFATQREAARQRDTQLAVISMGIDRFGIINATMGHQIGDQVIRAVADMLQAAIGRDDMVARVSGDRFLVLVSGLSGRKDLVDAAERLHGIVQTSVWVGTEEFEISVSSGVSCYPRDGDEVETLIKNAEAALHRAKGQGAGSLQIFTKEMSSRAAKTLSLQTKLRRAIDHGEFIPYYQPQVDLRSGQVVGMEALVRWKSPDGAMIAPGEFIPIAEETGLIDGICDFMLTECARQNRAWQDQGLSAIPVAVNVSGRQFQSTKRLMSALDAALDQSGLPPHYLEIELTESSAMRDADSAIAVVQQLREKGISTAIDDFGTGYSSLSVLKRFPISKLKIDRSFVMDIISDPNDAAIVDAIIAMARALRMKVIAEGVEQRQHLEFLRNLGCDQIQGYYFSRPLPATEMERLLRENRLLDAGPFRRRKA